MCIPIHITEGVDLSDLKGHPSYVPAIPLKIVHILGSNLYSIDSRKRGVFSLYLNDEVSVCDYVDSVVDPISNASASRTLSNSYWCPFSQESDNYL